LVLTAFCITAQAQVDPVDQGVLNKLLYEQKDSFEFKYLNPASPPNTVNVRFSHTNGLGEDRKCNGLKSEPLRNIGSLHHVKRAPHLLGGRI
jgi:hypothetical protein